MSIEKAEAAQAAVETMLEAVAADPGQQQLSTALLQAQSDLGEGVAIIDPQTQRFVYVNDDALCQLYGYSAAELLALPSFLTLIVSEEQGAFRTHLAQCQQGQPTENHYKLAVRRKDGMRITIKVAVTQTSGPNGPQLVTLIRDITAHKQTEEALRQTHAALEQQVQERAAALAAMNERLTTTLAEQQRITATLQESEARYRLLADHATDVITRHALDGTFLYVSPAIRTLLGYEPEELLGRSALELFHPEDAPRITQLVTEAIAQGKTATYTYRVRHKDGHYVWGETNSQPVRDAATGEVQAVVAVARDITARKQVEETLRHSEERFRIALAHSPITVFHQDIDLRYTWVYNPIPGFRVEDMLGKRDDELLPPQEAAPLMAVKQQSLASRQRVHQEVSYVFQGTTYSLRLNGRAVMECGGAVSRPDRSGS
jgi:PAS domain S-box-containing protein